MRVLPRLVGVLHDLEGFVDVVGDVQGGGRRVSSTWVRELLAAGQVEDAARLLGRPHAVRAEVVHGLKRGRELGYPTANLATEAEGFIPADGVYAGWLVDEGTDAGGYAPATRYAAAISVGGNPTFGDVEGTVVEAYLIGFEGDAYDRPLRVEFTRFLRHELAFETVEELVEQMWRDIETARALAEESGQTG